LDSDGSGRCARSVTSSGSRCRRRDVGVVDIQEVGAAALLGGVSCASDTTASLVFLQDGISVYAVSTVTL